MVDIKKNVKSYILLSHLNSIYHNIGLHRSADRPPRPVKPDVMPKQKRHFFPRSKSDKLWLAALVGPPGIYLIYMVYRFILSYDGRYHVILGDYGPECSLFEFIWSELTSTFFLPFFVLITLSWMATIGVIYFGVRIFKRIQKENKP